jgi:hypothetical protein
VLPIALPRTRAKKCSREGKFGTAIPLAYGSVAALLQPRGVVEMAGKEAMSLDKALFWRHAFNVHFVDINVRLEKSLG